MSVLSARALPLVLAASIGLMACGDPLLPSDYSGPPEGAVGANVLNVDRHDTNGLKRPLMHVAWLTQFDAQPSNDNSKAIDSLAGQQVSYQRSEDLINDWDIGLSAPAEAVQMVLDVDMQPVTLAVGKIVYFDDRVADGRLDWSCSGAECDRVMAISNEFIVYVERPLSCGKQPGTTPNKTAERLSEGRLSRGYHYFVLEGNQPVEIEADGSLNFLVEDRDAKPVESDPTRTLQEFTRSLLWDMQLDLLQGC